MARLPRLALPGHMHYVIQRAHPSLSGHGVFADDADRGSFLAALRTAAAAERVQVHAYALLPEEVQLLTTPEEGAALGRFMQALGRSYVSAYNRRHGHHGSLWDGRYRCAVVEAGATRLAALILVDGQSREPGVTSAQHRSGGPRDPALNNPPEIWQLGNTPFEREASYRELLSRGLPAAQADTLRRAALGGWVAGSAAFAARLADIAARPTRPRSPGRPRHSLD
jgi:putative transposase